MGELTKSFMRDIADPSEPINRILRKSIFLMALSTVGLIYYFIVTQGWGIVDGLRRLIFMLLAVLAGDLLWLIGVAIVGGFYEAFLKAVGATNKEQSLPVFIFEWFLTLLIPTILLIYVGGVSWQFGI